MNTCPHYNKVGDNYGWTCNDCGKIVAGFGYGGWFGRNLTGFETPQECIHNFVPMGDDGDEVCIYCETWRKTETQ